MVPLDLTRTEHQTDEQKKDREVAVVTDPTDDCWHENGGGATSSQAQNVHDQ